MYGWLMLHRSALWRLCHPLLGTAECTVVDRPDGRCNLRVDGAHAANLEVCRTARQAVRRSTQIKSAMMATGWQVPVSRSVTVLSQFPQNSSAA
jgi:hypothetical protein